MSGSLRPSKNNKIDKIADLIPRKAELPVITQTIQVYSEEDFELYVQSHRFDRSKRPAEHDVILYQADQEIGSRSNILAITGRAKSRKSAIVSAILSSMLSPNKENVLGFTANISDDEQIIHVDTEQSQADYWRGLDRTFSRSGPGVRGSQFHSIYARDADIDFLSQVTEYLFRKHKPRVAVIDGVADYILDINNHEGVSKLGRRIMKWSTDYDCLVIVVIHTTKTTGFMTGAFGTWFEKKAETVLKCEKPDDQQEITTVSCQYARDVPFKPFTIMWDFNQDHYSVVDESKIVQPKGPTSTKAPSTFADDIHDQVLRKIFLVSSSVPQEQILKAIATHARDVTRVQLGSSLSSRWLNYYRDKTWILCDPSNNWSRVIITKADGETSAKPPTATDDLPF